MKKLFFCICLFAGLTILACSKPYRVPSVFPPEAEFSGIDILLSGDYKAANLVMIHGSCHKDIGWFLKNLKRFASEFNMKGGDFEIVFNGGDDGVKAYRGDLTGENRRLRLYGIIYSDVIKPFKQKELCRDVSIPTKICSKAEISYKRERAEMNATLKNVLINDCFADVVAYLGPLGQKIRTGVQNAIRAIVDDSQNDKDLKMAGTVFIGESLGSKVLGDAMLCAQDDTITKLLPFFAKTKTVFLRSNQIPLLNIGSREARCDNKIVSQTPANPNSPYESFRRGPAGTAAFINLINIARDKGTSVAYPFKIPERYTVVAFTDPNDLLSYEIRSSDVCGMDVVNVIVSNADTVFGWMENPEKAHNDYWENQNVIEFLRCGRAVNGKTNCP